MEINFTPKINSQLARLGLYTKQRGKTVLNEFELELPCGLFHRLGDRIKMGAFSYILSERWQDNVSIGRYCSIAENVKLNMDRHPSDWLSTSPFQYNRYKDFLETCAPLDFVISRPTVIGSDVWIGDSVLINEGVTIGDGAIVGSGALVTKSVPPYAIVVGSPASILRYRFPAAVIERLLALKWWEYDYRDFFGSCRGENLCASVHANGRALDHIPFDNVESAIDQIASIIESGKIQKYRGKVLTRDDFAAFRSVRDKIKGLRLLKS